MAGGSLKELEADFPGAELYRAMPNTPSLIGEGTTTLCGLHEGVHEENVREMLSSIGGVYDIEGEELHITIPLDGSMPAYLFYFAQGFIQEAVARGIEERKRVPF